MVFQNFGNYALLPLGMALIMYLPNWSKASLDKSKMANTERAGDAASIISSKSKLGSENTPHSYDYSRGGSSINHYYENSLNTNSRKHLMPALKYFYYSGDNTESVGWKPVRMERAEKLSKKTESITI